MKQRKSWVCRNIASGLHICLLTLREYSRKWQKYCAIFNVIWDIIQGVKEHVELTSDIA